jgi:chloramphenicol 3-O phosphotransferase
LSGIIFLHGASSSGKSTLARALQQRLEAPFWHYSIDHLRDAGVLPSARITNGDFQWRDMRTAFFDGFHRSIAAFADAGNNIILEHILDTPGWREQLARLLAAHDVLFVGLHLSVEELNRREKARRDRPAGSAEADFHSIHRGLRYDVEVQTNSELDVNVATILSAWSGPRGRSKLYDTTGEHPVQVARVVPVLLREKHGRREMLVLRHPTAGLQVVKGTPQPNEQLSAAALRELEEKSGVTGARVVRCLDSSEAQVEGELWHFFHCAAGEQPSRWINAAPGDGDQILEFFWRPLDAESGSDWNPILATALAHIRATLARS